MRILVQRVSEASVTIDGSVLTFDPPSRGSAQSASSLCSHPQRRFSRIGAGLLLFVGVEEADGDEDIEWLAGKVARLRIFDDADGVMNLDIMQAGGEVLAVSQFTLHASTRKGNRPSYIRSARPEISKPLYERFCARLARELGYEEGEKREAAKRAVQTGVFGADMKVALVNDGPVTIWIDSKNRE